MTLTKRIIPCLDVENGRVVKGINFQNLRDAGDPVRLAQEYSERGADELVFLDITASVENRQPLYKMVREVASRLTIPFTVGGGIRTVEEARILLSNGADKIAVNTAAVESPILIQDLAASFGKQCVVVAIDANRREEEVGGYEVFTYGGRRATGIDAIEWAKEVEKLEAGEILLTSMNKDGTKSGYDIKLTRAVSRSLRIPVIASGGAGGPKTFYEVLTTGCADAALAASSFHYDEYSIKEVKHFLKSRGVEMRI